MSHNAKFVLDIQKIRAEARAHIEQGAVTDHNETNKTVVIELLNAALATELVCVLRYKAHACLCKGVASEAIKEEFKVHAAEELAHVDQLAERIVQLGGVPNFSPEGILQRSHADFNEPTTLKEMIKENLIAERIAIACYSEIVRYLGNDDPTTRRLIESILAQEEEHADELSDWLDV